MPPGDKPHPLFFTHHRVSNAHQDCLFRCRPNTCAAFIPATYLAANILQPLKHPSTPHRLIHYILRITSLPPSTYYILRITSLPPSTYTTSSLQHHLSSRISYHAMNTPLETQDPKSDHGGTETQLTRRDSGLMDVSSWISSERTANADEADIQILAVAGRRSRSYPR
jgi:hypothetical protein